MDPPFVNPTPVRSAPPQLNGVLPTLAHQEMYQVPLAVQKTLMTMGTQVLGVTTDEEAALSFARRYFAYEPNAVKAYRPVYHDAMIIDHTPVEFTVDEQATLNSYHFTKMQTYQFWIAPCQKEGSPQTDLLRADISRFDQGKYVNEPLVREFRSRLARRSSLYVDRALELIYERHEKALPSNVQEDHEPRSASSESSPLVPPPQRSKRKKKPLEPGLRQ
jgi:hypothetical protein